jgi:hypothetical protein
VTFVTGLRDRPDRPASPRERGEALGGRADVPTKMVELRFLVKVSLPVEAGNAAAKKDGFKVIQTILEQRLQQMHLSDPEIL